MLKRLLTVVALVATMTTSAFADITLVVPQKPGSGTTVWTEIVAKQLEPFLGEKINIKLIPGARDIPGVNKWHNEMRDMDDHFMVTHGGNGVSFLADKVDYNYAEYESIGLMNLNIIAAHRTDADKNKPSFSSGSGMVPEAFAMTLLICGPDKSMDEYIACFKDNVNWVKGMKGSERRLAFKRGELSGTRENPAAFKKHAQPTIDAGDAELWFHHGILDAANARHNDDPNYPGYQLEILFEQKWGVAPSGEFYNAYVLVKSFRDGLQKAIWAAKGNPNAEKLRVALTKMSQDPDATAAIAKKVGNYEWLIGGAGDQQRDTLMTFITEDALKNLVRFNVEALDLKAIYKPNLLD
jgi:hypothetical protein